MKCLVLVLYLILIVCSLNERVRCEMNDTAMMVVMKSELIFMLLGCLVMLVIAV